MTRREISDAQVDAIVGAFLDPDRAMFRALLTATELVGGDLAEFGVLYGASAVVIGSSRGEGETFTVVDLFETESSDEANAVENASSYPALSRRAFEDNYRALLHELPVIVQDYSSTIVDHAAHGTHRFVHVDASHLYDHVVQDVVAARTLLRDEGIVVFDDIRQEHTPGVAAAVWQAIISEGLKPVAISPYKFYGTWGDPNPHRAVLQQWVDTDPWWTSEIQRIGGFDVLRVYQSERPAPSRHPWKPYVPEVLWPAAARARRLLSRGG